MLAFPAVPLAMLATTSRLVEQPHSTLLMSAGALGSLQALRSIATEGSDVYSAFLTALLALLLSPAVALVMVLFGAPVVSHQIETLLCGLVLSVLNVQPLLTLYGLDAETWRQIISLQLPVNDVYLGSVCGVVGAWFGVWPIALDWDRPWQAFPITIVLGSYIGYFIGSVAGSFFPAAKAPEIKKTKRVHK